MSRVAVTDLARCEPGARCESIAVGLCLSRSCVLCYVFLGAGHPVVAAISDWRWDSCSAFLRSSVFWFAASSHPW